MNSKILGLKEFDFIKVEKDESNIEDIINFCGVPSHGVEQELIFHNEGSPYIFNNIEVCGMNEGYILKFKDGSFEVVSNFMFNKLFC